MATTIQHIELPKKARAVDTSGNNNHGQIYSGRALEFDGVTDHLNLGSNITVSTGAWTLACWVNIVSTPTNVAFSVNSNSVGGNTSAYIGIFASSLKLAVYDWGNTAWKESNTPLKLNTWCRIIFSYDGSGTLTFYQNGIADGEVTLGASGNDAHFFARYIGSMSNETRHFDGKMANWQAWDAAFTQADVTYDYLNPESLALNNSGTALTESNLKLWYPMQDGHRGQQSYILDGANTGAVSEKVINGDFATGSNWSFYNSSLVGEAVRINNVGLSGINAYIIQHSILEAGRFYKFECDVISTNGKDLFLENSIPANTSVGATTVGHKSIYFTQGAGTQLTLKRLVAETDVTVDNVSIKAINDKHHATTVFYGDELVTNGDCESAPTINSLGLNGNATHDIATIALSTEQANGGSKSVKVTADSSSNTPNIKFVNGDASIADGSDLGLIAGRTYALSADVYLPASQGLTTLSLLTKNGSGSDTLLESTTTTALWVTLNGTFVDDDSDIPFRIQGSSDIDNISLKEVGVASGWTDADQQLHIPQTALQSYNELAWSDGNANVKVEVASLAADLGSSDFSISHVLSPNNITGNNTYLAFNVGSSDGRVIHRIDDEVVEIYIEDSNANTASYEAGSGAGAIKAGQTYHIVEVFDRAADLVTVYINGVASGTTIDISSLNGDIDCNGALGFYNFSSDPAIEGFITEVALWKNTKLDATEVLELYNDGKPLDALTHTKASTLYGYWRNNGLSTWVNLANPGTKDSTTNTLTETILIPQGVDSTRDAQGFIMNRQKSTSCLNLTLIALGGEGSFSTELLSLQQPLLPR
jgi:hypothetical protein